MAQPLPTLLSLARYRLEISYTVRKPVDKLVGMQHCVDERRGHFAPGRKEPLPERRKQLKQKLRLAIRRKRDFQDDFHAQLANFLAKKHSTLLMQRPNLREWRAGLSTKSRYRLNAACGYKFFDRLVRVCVRHRCHRPDFHEGHTTVGCSGCGAVRPMSMDIRVYECDHCGLVMGRDVNSAKDHILKAFTFCKILPTESAAIRDAYGLDASSVTRLPSVSGRKRRGDRLMAPASRTLERQQ